jgi:hypothetical protein
MVAAAHQLAIRVLTVSAQVAVAVWMKIHSVELAV